MSWGFLKRFEPFYAAHKEVLLYLFFGGVTTVVSVVTFALGRVMFAGLPAVSPFGLTFETDIVAANVFSWICAVTIAYVNRIWVFETSAVGFSAIAKECAAFFAGRLFTLIVETVLLELSISKLCMNDVAAKILVQIVTIVLNYIISKLLIFKSDTAEAQS